MKRVLIPVLVAVAFGGAAAAHGRLTGRWLPLPPVGTFVEKLPAVPLAAGDWAGEDVPLPDGDSLGRAGIAGYLHRRYQNRVTGDVVTVLIVCGRPGPISVHTPDVCYRDAGYVAVGDAEAADLDGGRTKFWRLQFRPPAGRVDARNLDIYWAWLAGSAAAKAGFEAPTVPRFHFRNEPAIFKLYAIREVAPVRTGAAPAGDVVARFLAAFLPPAQEALRPAG